MKNKEKYKDQIMHQATRGDSCNQFVNGIILKSYGLDCNNLPNCSMCRLLSSMWLEEEVTEQHNEPVTKWDKVKTDTLIIIDRFTDPKLRYFKDFFDNTIRYYSHGRSSVTALGVDDYGECDIYKCKIATKEDIECIHNAQLGVF